MEFVHTLTKEECMKLASGDPGKAQGSNLGAAGIVVPGSAGETSDCVKEKGLASLALADGPAGLRLTKYYYVKMERLYIHQSNSILKMDSYMMERNSKEQNTISIAPQFR